MARLPVEFFDPSAKQQLLDLPSEELKRRALELLAQVSKGNPYGDEEQIYRQVGRALDRLQGAG